MAEQERYIVLREVADNGAGVGNCGQCVLTAEGSLHDHGLEYACGFPDDELQCLQNDSHLELAANVVVVPRDEYRDLRKWAYNGYEYASSVSDRVNDFDEKFPDRRR